jgi:metal-responsive CopG/Arc/MetJ family transcriptional regulator
MDIAQQGKIAKTKKERVSSRLEATKIFIEALIQEEKSEEQRIKNSGILEALINHGKIEKVTKKIQGRFNDISSKIISSIKEDDKLR